MHLDIEGSIGNFFQISNKFQSLMLKSEYLGTIWKIDRNKGVDQVQPYKRNKKILLCNLMHVLEERREQNVWMWESMYPFHRVPFAGNRHFCFIYFQIIQSQTFLPLYIQTHNLSFSKDDLWWNSLKEDKKYTLIPFL